MTTARSTPDPESAPIQVLVVDDDAALRRLLEQSLGREGFDVTAAPTAEAALVRVAEMEPDAVIVDLYLPGMSGLDFLEELRERRIGTPVILLTSEQSEGTRVMSLDRGADDYVVKPFSPRVLAARLRAVLRRSSPAPRSVTIEHGDLTIDLASHVAEIAGKPVQLTFKEFELLALLAAHPGRAFTYDELLTTVWESRRDWQDPGTVTEHVRRLRSKLGETADDSRITTLRGVGYRFDG